MAESFYIKQGDTAPALRATLKDPDGTAVDLTGATVKFSMRTASGTVLVNKQSVTLVTANAGIVEYAWQAGDTDTAGTHLGEFEVTHTDATVETFPNDSYARVIVTPQVA